jgi:hypothetical protein
MIVEMRTYSLKSGSLGEWLRLYEERGLPVHKQILGCESAPKWDPFSSPGKHLISARKFVRGGVQVAADRDPCWWRAFSVRSATYAEISRGSTLVPIHSEGPACVKKLRHGALHR